MPVKPQFARAFVGALLPTTLGWFIPQLFGRRPPRIIPIYEMRKVADASVPATVEANQQRIRAWLDAHVRSRIA